MPIQGAANAWLLIRKSSQEKNPKLSPCWREPSPVIKTLNSLFLLNPKPRAHSFVQDLVQRFKKHPRGMKREFGTLPASFMLNRRWLLEEKLLRTWEISFQLIDLAKSADNLNQRISNALWQKFNRKLTKPSQETHYLDFRSLDKNKTSVDNFL